MPVGAEARITVGRDAGDIRGCDERALQAAVDHIAALGGGTVRVLAGDYRMRNAVFLRSGVAIEGAGSGTRLIKGAGPSTDLAEDADWYQDEVVVRDATAFQPGDGVTIDGEDPHRGGANVVTRTVVAVRGNALRLDRQIRSNFWLTRGAPKVLGLHSLVTAPEGTRNIAVRRLALDGSRAENAHIQGDFAACVYFQDCRGIHVEEVEARAFHGDGISWQICDDVTVERCLAVDNTDLGLHAGSGSRRSVIRDNRVEGNRIGIYLCWGIRHSVVDGNRVVRSVDHGISVGHRDTDNRITRNTVMSSGKVGILFRDGLGPDRAPHRNIVEFNRIVDTGDGRGGIGIAVLSATDEVTLRDNEIVETRPDAQGIGIRIGPDAGRVPCDGNRVSPALTALQDHRSTGA